MSTTYDKHAVQLISDILVGRVLYGMLYDRFEYPNVSFDFKESEAKHFLIDAAKNESYFDDDIKYKTIFSIINVDYSKPVIEVSDYKRLFTLIYNVGRKYWNEDRVCGYMNSIGNIFKMLIIRMTPDDFKHPEDFFERQYKILIDSTFDDYNAGIYYDQGKYLESVSFYDGLNIKGYNLRTSMNNECSNEFYFEVSDGTYVYELPRVRYGIYDNNGLKTCEIGSIQSKSSRDDKMVENELSKRLRLSRTSINKKVSDSELLDSIEPNKLISLILFVKLLYERGIFNISVPSMYVLDLDFHEQLYMLEKHNFRKKYGVHKIRNNDNYNKEFRELIKKENNSEFISKTKTTDFIRLFDRLVYHFPNIDITNYPNELSSFMNLKINSLDNARGNARKLIK